MTYIPAKFEVATPNGLGGDAFTKNMTDEHMHTWTDGWTDRLWYEINITMYPFFLKKKAGNITEHTRSFKGSLLVPI